MEERKRKVGQMASAAARYDLPRAVLRGRTGSFSRSSRQPSSLAYRSRRAIILVSLLSLSADTVCRLPIRARESAAGRIKIRQCRGKAAQRIIK